MFEDGVYVSYFTEDVKKQKDPKSVVLIQDEKVNIMINPSTDDVTKNYLKNIAKELDGEKSKDKYVDIATIGLGTYWEWNGYTPNPSDFFEIDSTQGNKALELARTWDTKE